MDVDLEKIIREIGMLDENAMAEARARQDKLIKPIGSLGRIEELAIQLAGITGEVYRSYAKKAIIVMCADNGVYAENVSLAPKETTLMMSMNFMKFITGVGVLSKLSGSDLRVVDIGIDSDVESPNMLNRKIRKGTGNLARELAMTREEAIKAIEVGFEQATELANAGYDVIGTGEMGLANTTSSALVIMSLTGCSVDSATGKGSGLTDELYIHKKKLIEAAYQMHKPDKDDPIDILSKVGGLDIAGLAGVYLGAAYHRKPVVIDGVISAAAAIVATRLCPNAKNFMVPSHISEEPGYSVTLRELDIRPYFDLGMRLGEGTGCPFTFLLIDAAEKIVKEIATFEEASIDDSTLVDIRK